MKRNFFPTLALLLLPAVLSAQTWKIQGESKGIAQLISPQVLVVGGSSNKLYLSMDGGLTNSHEIVKAKVSASYGFIPHLLNENYGIGAGYNLLTYGKDIWKTTDGGKTWDLVASPDFASTAYKVDGVGGISRMQFVNEKTGVFFGKATRASDGKVTQAIFYTSDTGHTVTEITPPDVKTFSLPTLDVKMIDENTIYVLPGGGYGFFKTIDKGANWTKISTEPATMIRKLQVVNNDLMFILQDGGTGKPKLIKSTNGGTVWTSIDSLPKMMGTRKVVSYGDISFVDEMNGLLVGSDGYSGAIFITEDGGETWAQTTLPTEITDLTGSWGAGGLHFITKTFAYAGAADKFLVFGEDGSVSSKQILPQTSSVFLYPNPAKNNVQVKMENLNGNTVLNIIQLNGKTVSTKRINATGNYIENISLQNLKSGIYIIEVISGNNILRQKLIVQ